MTRTRLSTCVHEGSHALTAQTLRWADVLGLRVNDDMTGACYFGDQEDGEAGLRHDMVVSVAGRVGEAIADGRDPRDLNLVKVLRFEGAGKGQRCTYSDFVWRRAQLTGDPDPAAAVRWVDKELPIAADLAAFILRRHWAELRDLAALLSVDSVVFTEAGKAAFEAAA